MLTAKSIFIIVSVWFVAFFVGGLIVDAPLTVVIPGLVGLFFWHFGVAIGKNWND